MANPSPPENWNAAYETNPVNGDIVEQGDDWFRQLKTDVRLRAEVEHHFSSINGFDNGLHREGSARVFVGTAAPTTLGLTDHDNTGGAGVVNLNTAGSNTDPTRVGHGRVWFNSADGSLSVYNATAGWVPATNMPRGHLGGLNLTVTGAGDDLTITPGECRTGTSANASLRNATLAATLIKQIDAPWALGTNAGGYASAVGLAPSTWYHFFVIVSPTGVVDAGWDVSPTAANILANAAVQAAGFTAGNTTYRRIASIRTTAASEVTPFIQHGDMFWWNSPTTVDSFAPLAANADVSATLTFVPPNVRTLAQLAFRTFGAITDNLVMTAGGGNIGANGLPNTTPLNMMSGTSEFTGIYSILTDTSRNIRLRTGDATNDINIQVHGYIDARGRWD